MRYQTALRPDAVVDCIKQRSPTEWRNCLDFHSVSKMDEPGDEQNGHGKDGEEHDADGCEEEPVAPLLAAWMLEVAGEQHVVAAVGLPRDVEGISEERHGADDDVEREIDDHARDSDVGCAARPCGEDDDGRGETGEDVADAGDEADDAVQAEADGGAGDAEPRVEKTAKDVQIFVPKKTIGRIDMGAGWEDLGFALRGHFRCPPLGFWTCPVQTCELY